MRRFMRKVEGLAVAALALVGAGQVVEQGRFTAVRVTGKCNLNAHCVFLSSLWNQTTSIISASALRTLSS